MQLDVHADGSGQGKEVVRVDYARASGGPDVRQVEDLKFELTGVSWEGISDCEIEKYLDSLLLVTQLQGGG